LSNFSTELSIIDLGISSCLKTLVEVVLILVFSEILVEGNLEGLIVELEEVESGELPLLLLQLSSTLEFKSSKLGEVNVGLLSLGLDRSTNRGSLEELANSNASSSVKSEAFSTKSFKLTLPLPLFLFKPNKLAIGLNKPVESGFALVESGFALVESGFGLVGGFVGGVSPGLLPLNKSHIVIRLILISVPK
jgi:hypothetical protein